MVEWNNIVGASYVGVPKPNTVMFAAKKVASLLHNLADITNCFIFAEKGMEVTDTFFVL